jgi:hypothetical protein
VKPYKAKSLKSAQTLVRQLRRQIAVRDDLLTKYRNDRKVLAKMAAETPQFFNPLDVSDARRLRDAILGGG